MKKEFVPYEQSLELKELGFNEYFDGWYYRLDGKLSRSNYELEFEDASECIAPLYSQAFRWFREKHDLFSLVHRMEYLEEYYYMWVIEGGDWRSDYETYEEAELACLKKLIEIAKNK